MKTKVYNLKNEPVGEVELDDSIFTRSWNPDLVHQALLAQAANRRPSLAHAKTRAEVSGGGRKPWRQKGTGRARHGSIRSPLWRGGGVSHGPTNKKIFARKINKKMLRAAIHSVLSKRLKLNELKVLDSLKLESAKTKVLFSVLKVLCGAMPNALLITASDNDKIHRAARNIPKVKNLYVGSLNVEDLLKYKAILLEKNAIAEIK